MTEDEFRTQVLLMLGIGAVWFALLSVVVTEPALSALCGIVVLLLAYVYILLMSRWRY